MLRPFPQYSGVTDVYGDVAHSIYHSLQLTIEQRRVHGLVVNANYTYSRTEDDLAARTGYDFAQDWADRGQRSAAHLQPDRGLRPAVRQGGPAGRRQRLRRRARPRLAGVGDHAGPFGPAARLVRRRLQPAQRRHLLRRLQPGLLGPGPHQRRLRRRRRARDGAAHLHRSQRVRVGAGVHLGNTPRTMAFDLRNPGSVNQDLSIQRDFGCTRSSRSGSAPRSSTCSTRWCSAASTPTSPTPTSAGSARRPTSRASRS